MYEIMPTDSLQLYAEKDPAERVALFGNSVPAEVKQEFAKDGGPPAENEADPSRVWRRVKALKSFDVAVKVDGKEEQQTVNEGTELVLDPKSAEERIAAGDVAPVEGNDKVYRRSLRDYALLYRDYNLRIDALVRRIEETAGQLAVVTEANAKVTADLAIRDKEKAALASDKARFVAEQERITKHVLALKAELDAVGENLKQTYIDNLRKEEELVRLTYEIADLMRNRVVARP
jgi:hypothetical protein